MSDSSDTTNTNEIMSYLRPVLNKMLLELLDGRTKHEGLSMEIKSKLRRVLHRRRVKEAKQRGVY